MKKQNWKIKLGIGLMIISVPLFLAIPVIPFLEMENGTKVKLTTIILVAAEIIFWSGGLLVGKELFAKYKSYFNPKNWFSSSKNKDSDLEREKEEEKERI